MPYYIESNNIDIFPCSINRTTDRKSKLFYEENISNLVRQVTDYHSFIISGGVDINGNVTATLCLTLFGYYIEIKPGTNLTSNISDTTNLFIKLNLTEKSDTQPQELHGQDNGTTFEAVELTTTESEYSLSLLIKDDTGWKLDSNSYVKFKQGSIFGLDEIDGDHEIY